MSVLADQHARTWQPPATWSREQVIATCDAVLARPAGEVKEAEGIAPAAAQFYHDAIIGSFFTT